MRLVKTSVQLIVVVAILFSTVKGQSDGSGLIPQRSKRILMIGNATFLNQWNPTITTGAVYQISLRKPQIVKGEFEQDIIMPPRFYGHFLLSGGINGDYDDYAILGQIGILRRMDSPTFTFFGFALQGVLPDKAFGPVVRVEIIDNIGLQTGILFYSERDEMGIFVSIDYFRELFSDLF